MGSDFVLFVPKMKRAYEHSFTWRALVHVL